MQRKLLLLLLASLFIMPAYCAPIKKFKPLKPMQIPTIQDSKKQQYYNNQQTTNHINQNESYPKITILEENIFGKNYETENIYSRLSRLEKKLFNKNFENISLANRVDNLLSNIDTGVMYGIKSNDIAKIESKIIGRTYPNDDTESRITRLEKEMLGAMQDGNLKERFEVVKKASKHYNSFPEIVQSQIPYQPQTYRYSGYSPSYNFSTGWGNNYSSWNRNPSYGVANILNNMARRVMGSGIGRNNINGTLTGYTPPIYDYYNPYALQPGLGQQDYAWNNRGWRLKNRNTGSGTTVRILD